MTSEQTQGLIGALVVLGVLVLITAPAVAGVIRDRRIDRQLRQAERREAARDGGTPPRRAGSPSDRSPHPVTAAAAAASRTVRAARRRTAGAPAARTEPVSGAAGPPDRGGAPQACRTRTRVA